MVLKCKDKKTVRFHNFTYIIVIKSINKNIKTFVFLMYFP